MRQAVLLAAVALGFGGCEGSAGELGDYAAPEAVVVDPNAPKVLAFSCDATAVNASVPVACTIQATHPEGEPVTCTLDRGDGRPPLELGDCLAPRNATVRFATPGRATLTLTVTDAEGRSSTRTVVIDVTGNPNQPPLLTDFKATPASGATPLVTTLTWTATDAEGDALRCDLDVGADGTPEYSGLDCAVGRQVIDLRALGVHEVRLTARDELDAWSEATLSLEVLEPRGDLRISRVDFGQSVVKETLALVEGKPALLRVSVLANEADLPARVAVEASKGGAALGSLPLTGPTLAPVAEDLSDLSKQYRVTLPPEWVTPGVRLEVKVDPDNALPETDEGNNTRAISPTVTRGHVLHLTAVPVVQGGLTGSVRDVDATVTDVWPVKGVEAKTRAPYTFSGVLTGGGGTAWGALLDDLAQVKAADGSQRNYYGFVRVNYGSGIAGIGYLGQGVATGRDDSLGTVAHELGHNFGRPHAPCGGVAGADPNFPYAGAKIGSWGWNGAQLLSPTRYVDLMSYCSPEWVSDYSYEKAQQFMSGRQQFAPDVMLPDLRWVDAALVSGRVLPTGEVRWAPVQRIHAALGEQTSGDAVVILSMTDGTRLRVPVALHETSEADERHFVAVIAWPGELSDVRLELAGREVSRRVARAGGAPFRARAERLDDVTVRVRWSGLEHLAVAHLGGERTTLALGASGEELVVRVDGLAGGVLELSGSDGVRSERVAVPMP
ncbi:MAG: M66 family metalloprotease [Myxococcota bacterium]